MEVIDYTKLLPEDPPEGFTGWILNHGGFAKKYLIYRHGRRLVPLEARWEDCVEVTCSECGQTFRADKVSTGGCGHCYAPAPFGWLNWETGESVISGDGTLCPACGSECETVHIGNMRPFVEDSEYTTVVSRIEVAGKTDRLLLTDWRTDRTIDKWGNTSFRSNIWTAWVVEEKKIIRLQGYQQYFNTISRRGPVQRKTFYDNYDKCIRLYPMEGGVLEGTTAENCKLDRYTSDGGVRLVAYLALWRKRPQVENLIVQGCAKLVDDLIEKEQCAFGRVKGIPKLERVNWKKKKPHQMMRMSKDEWRSWGRSIDARGYLDWTWALDNGVPVDRERLELLRANEGSLKSILDLVGPADFYRSLRYLQKQKQSWVVLRDYWNMAGKLDMDLEAEQVKWPKDIHKAHDAAVKRYNERKDALDNAAFVERLKTLGGMEWHDGGILIRPCASAAELRAEGSTLNHCVYSYADRHKNGQTAIFFIRREEEPDKPWFTLELDEKNLTVRQNRGLRNCGKTPEVQEFEDKWIEHLKQMRKKTKLRKKKKEEQAA